MYVEKEFLCSADTLLRLKLTLYFESKPSFKNENGKLIEKEEIGNLKEETRKQGCTTNMKIATL